jgi:hypothetical protein
MPELAALTRAYSIKTCTEVKIIENYKEIVPQTTF